jgi:tRNA pseudouridine32 synthase/23S rRNA pseudouridine746 synthase
MLHAAALIFPHPGGGLKRLEAPTPPDMAALLHALQLD